MALSVNPQTFVISVPKADLTLVQSTPTEIRELNLNTFRLELKLWEAEGYNANPGITFLKTHEHNTEVSLGGLTYARVIEILEPYTITFEDGQYAVNLTGANSNVGDRVNVNQVSVRSANSAGLISSPDIEYASYSGGVTVDVNSPYQGTAFPTGTERQKVNNIADALLIADYRGFNTIYMHSDITLGIDANMNDFVIEGRSHVEIDIVIEPDASVERVSLISATISGTLDGDNEISGCIVEDLDYVNGHIHASALHGTIALGGAADAYVVGCSQMDMNVTPAIDMGGSGQNLVMPDYTGSVEIYNMTGAAKIGIGLDGGQVILDTATVTAGFIHVSGVGRLVDENNQEILSGTWNGVTVINELINRATITEAAQLGEAVYVDTINGESGTLFPLGTRRNPVDNLDDATTIADREGIQKLVFLSNYTFNNTVYIADYHLYGETLLETIFTFQSGCILYECTFNDCTMTGSIAGLTEITDSRLEDLGSVGVIPSSSEILVKKSLMDGTITMPSNYSGKFTVIDCYSNVVGPNTPTLDFGNSTATLQIRNYTGGIKITNATTGNVMSIDLVSGQVKLDSATVTNAVIVVRGSGKVIDADTGEFIPSGIWNGGVTVYNEAVNPEFISDTVWDETAEDHETENTIGDRLRRILYGSR